MHKLPNRSLTADELQVMRQEGVVRVPDFLSDPTVLQTLHTSVMPGFISRDYKMNGVLRALMRDGPIGALGASALNLTEVGLWSTNVFVAEGGHPGGYYPKRGDGGGAHVDVDNVPGYLLPFVTIWIALTDALRPVEFLRGSHLNNIKLQCPPCHVQPEHECLQALHRAGGGIRWWDVRAGDAIVFFSQTYHWAVLQANPRLALSVRMIDPNHKFDFYEEGTKLTNRMLPQWCQEVSRSVLSPVVYPRWKSTMNKQPWPIIPDCIDALGSPHPPVDVGKHLCGGKSPAWVSQFI